MTSGKISEAMVEALQAVVDVSRSGSDTISFLVELNRVARLCSQTLAAALSVPAPGEGAPILDTSISAETQAALDAIDDNIRAAAVRAPTAFFGSTPAAGALAVKALRDAMRQAMDIYQADAEPNIGEAMFEVLHASLSSTPVGEMVLVPKAEFDKLYKEADSLARCTDYNGRYCFMVAKHAFDEAMAGKKTAVASPQGGR